ncbi:putative 29 kDa ribonucleoprotein B, chloroplastic-like isoform X2 [Capsicum annuum]|uniref:29 kDa ribonucleoprotein B, chloroplastic n=1 Tax=Capsicum annuum TaxID=4072 RepID=UPI0007BF0912|nr:29 kDa ribonucleoprotein B, chloroplastic [Capsicum annuum]KAF3668917.1 putative 29 kDa ribonucleoprotein B, chloroplastic-like isoform X2 [Capsicum annuum]
MASSSLSSLQFLFVTPQTFSSLKPNSITTSFSFFSLPSSFSLNLSLSSSTLSMKPFESSRFVRKVALSEFDQLEDGVEEGEEEPSFSPDLKLFVGNLPFSVDSAALAEIFERAGNVEMVEVIYDKLTGRSRGFGFVTMSTKAEVEAAEQQFNGYEIDGRALRVNSGPAPDKRENSFGGGRGGRRENSSFGGPRGGRSFDSSNRVYVGNLSWGVDDLSLRELFSEQGKVVDAKVVYDRDSGRSRGFGFVTYSSATEVNNAIDSLNGVDLDGRSIRVSAAEERPPRRQF